MLKHITVLIAILTCASACVAQDSSKKVRVAAISFEPVKLDLAGNVKKLEAAYRKAALGGAKIAVAPEDILEGYVVNEILAGDFSADQMRDVSLEIDSPTIKQFQGLAKELDLCLVFGFAERINDDVFNAAIFIDNRGQICGKYHKMQLAEGYDPSWWFNRLGKQSRAFDTPFGRCGMLICNDRWNPLLAKIPALDGAQFLVIPSFGSTSKRQDEAVLARGVENHLPIVEANVGVTLVVNQDKIVAVDRKIEGITFADIDIAPPSNPAIAQRDRVEAQFLAWRDTEMPLRLARTAKAIESIQERKNQRVQVLKAMRTVMGSMPGDERRVALDVRIQEEVDCGSYVRRLITFQSEPDCRTPAYLCIPKSALPGARKSPAILCLHPTDNRAGHKVVLGLGGREGRQYAAELAERGFVTLSPAYPHLANYWPNLGKLGYASGTMKAIWDNTRALDLLSSMPEVDDSHGFGVIGHSLGGHNAIFTAVFDERIKVLVSSCGFDSFEDYYDGAERNWYFGKGWCQIRYMPRMSDYRGKLDTIPFDFPDLLGALAPRKVFVNAPLNDSNFRWKSVAKCADAARKIYTAHGATKNLLVRHPDCKHDFPRDLREEAYEVIASVLRPN